MVLVVTIGGLNLYMFTTCVWDFATCLLYV